MQPKYNAFKRAVMLQSLFSLYRYVHFAMQSHDFKLQFNAFLTPPLPRAGMGGTGRRLTTISNSLNSLFFSTTVQCHKFWLQLHGFYLPGVWILPPSFMDFTSQVFGFYLLASWILLPRCFNFTSQQLGFYPPRPQVLVWVGLGGIYCRFRFNLLLFLAPYTWTLHLKQISSCIKCTLLSNGATISI